MVLTFGYMDFLIFYKWTRNYWPDKTDQAPSIITVMINMPLAIGNPGDLNFYGDSCKTSDGDN